MTKFKTLLGAVAIASAMALVGCANPSAPSKNGGGSVPQANEDQQILDNAKSALEITLKVPFGQDKIVLPNKVNGVDVEWETSDKTIITSEGQVILQDEKKTVNLTAKLKYKDLTQVTKVFSVEVYGKNTKLTDSETLDIFLAQLTVTYPDSLLRIQTTLNTEEPLDSKNTRSINVSYKDLSGNDNVKLENVEKGSKLTVDRDLVDYTAKIEVTAKLGDATKTKVVSVAVPKINNYVKYFFAGAPSTSENWTNSYTFNITNEYVELIFENKKKDGNTDTPTDKSFKQGDRYKYTIDTKNKTLSLVHASHMNQEGTGWITYEEGIKQEVDENIVYAKTNADAFKKFAETPTFEQYKVYKAAMERGETVEEKKYVEDLGPLLDNNPIKIDKGTVTDEQLKDFKGRTDSEKDVAAKKYLEKAVSQSIYQMNKIFGLDLKTSQDLINFFNNEELIRSKYTEMVKKQNPRLTLKAKYCVNEKGDFEFMQTYDDTKEWYEQKPYARYKDFTEGQNGTFFMINYQDEDGSFGGSIYLPKENNFSGRIIISKDGKTFKSEAGGPNPTSISGTLEYVKNDKKLKVAIKDGNTYYLPFWPMNLLETSLRK